MLVLIVLFPIRQLQGIFSCRVKQNLVSADNIIEIFNNSIVIGPAGSPVPLKCNKKFPRPNPEYEFANCHCLPIANC
jgi:hypothetical protein